MEITTMSQAMQLHAQALKQGSQPHHQNYSKLFTFSALSPHGNLSYARLILNSLSTPNSFFWNTMLRAYSESSYPSESFSLFITMLSGQFPAPKPDKFTYPFVLKACARIRGTHMGKQLHGLICKVGFDGDVYICNGLIHMYMKCGEVGFACKVFDEMLVRDVVSWTSIIDGFVDNGRCVDGVKFFEEMIERSGVMPNDATVVTVLKGCAECGALEVGRRVHRIVEGQGRSMKANVSTALIDMYCKCGCIETGWRVFEEMKDKDDVCAWTAMIHGLASHGLCKDAIDCFERMESLGVMPDERTMTAVLVACRNAGWVSEAYGYFESMRRKYRVKPNVQHYGCMVDLYARSGQLNEAEDFIRKMPIQGDEVLWRTVIWGCKIHGDTDRAERLIKEVNVDFDDCGSYVLLSNVYASAGKWHDKASLRETMNRQGIVKPPGSSKIEVDGSVHEFTAGDSSHIEAHEIYDKLEEICERLRGEGYEPELSEVLLEVDDEEKAFQLLHHSEKLVVAFGLMRTLPGSPIRIVKNLRSCEDCHAFMKLISQVYEREIIVRDRIRFHHFRNGRCTCGDYW